jgi:release factor glutamine methyltransferase
MVASNVDSGPWTVSRLLAWTREYLQRQHIESPRLCAELLLAHAMSCPRIRLYTQYESVPADEVLRRYREAVKAAAAGEPIAYLTGVKEFFALEFEVTPVVLIPRPETEVLVERTVRLLRDAEPAGRSILDLGTGSGCIAVALAKNLPAAAVYASDVSAGAIEVAGRNAARHGVAERIEFRVGDLFEPWSAVAPAGPDPSPKRQRGQTGDTGATHTGSALDPSIPRSLDPSDSVATRPGSVPLFDVIVSNPPYVATAPDTPVEENVRKYEPAGALFAGPDGLDVIRRIVAEAPRWLAPGGHLLMEMAFDQAHKVCDLLSSSRWQEVTTYRDAAGHERVVHARRPDEGGDGHMRV